LNTLYEVALLFRVPHTSYRIPHTSSMKIKPLLVMDHDFYSLRPECVALIFIIPPDPMNHVKIFKGWPPRDAPSKLVQLW